MADTKISALVAAAAAAAANELAINEAGTSKKISITQLVTLLQSLGMPIVTHLDVRYTNATPTGTEVTALSFNSLAVGTYFCRWALLYRAAAATSRVLAVNVPMVSVLPIVTLLVPFVNVKPAVALRVEPPSLNWTWVSAPPAATEAGYAFDHVPSPQR